MLTSRVNTACCSCELSSTCIPIRCEIVGVSQSRAVNRDREQRNLRQTISTKQLTVDASARERLHPDAREDELSVARDGREAYLAREVVIRIVLALIESLDATAPSQKSWYPLRVLCILPPFPALPKLGRSELLQRPPTERVTAWATSGRLEGRRGRDRRRIEGGLKRDGDGFERNQGFGGVLQHVREQRVRIDDAHPVLGRAQNADRAQENLRFSSASFIIALLLPPPRSRIEIILVST